jgi:hypothetical protein
MGKVDPMIYRGRIGPVIHYQVGNKYYTRSMPRKFRQTRATKSRAIEFGQASTIGASIRRILAPVISEEPDLKIRGRLVGVVFNWLQTHKLKQESSPDFLELSQFNYDLNHSSVLGRWKVNIETKNPSPGLVQIKIPAFVPRSEIVAPAGTKTVVCQIGIGSVNLKDGGLLKNSSFDLKFDYNNIPVEEKIISADLPTPKESLVVTGASLHYGILKNGKLKSNSNKAFMPEGIINILLV